MLYDIFNIDRCGQQFAEIVRLLINSLRITSIVLICRRKDFGYCSPVDISVVHCSTRLPSESTKSAILVRSRDITTVTTSEMNNGSDDGGGHSTTNMCSRYEHPGHDRIARELHDLRQRENEIRGRWKEMGFELPPICSDNETPFTLPAPIPNDVIARRPAHIDLVSSRSRDAVDGLSAFETMSVSSEASTSSSQNVAGTPTTADRYNSIKVRPYEDPDETEESVRRPAWTAYSPLEETPIQREIRHATEREHSLRQMRGLKPVESKMAATTSASNGVRQHQSSFVDGRGSVDDGYRAEVVDEVVFSNGDTSKSPSGRLSMRNFASARLQLEIEREKQRELDLVRLGCIRTTSVDHIAPLTSPDAIDPNHRHVGTNGDSSNRSRYVGAISSQFEQTLNEFSGDTPHRSAARGTDKDAGKTNGSTKNKRWSIPGSIVHRQETDGHSSVQPRQSVTSEMIERELRELKVRERELRMQRSDSVADDSDSDSGSPEVRHNGMTPSPGSDVTRPHKRTSCALIDQWEDRTTKQ